MTDAADRAARLSSLPGVTRAAAAARFGVTVSAVARARRRLGRAALQPAPADLVVAALSENGARRAGSLPADLAPIAAWVDAVNHDGCAVADVAALLAGLVARGILAVDGRRWRLVAPWP